MTGPDGQEVFKYRIDHAAVPLLIGTLLSATPTDQPSTLVLSMSYGITPEVMLHLKDNNLKDSHINGPLMRGLKFSEGVPVGGGVRVVITGPQGFERAVLFALDEDPAVITERVRETIDE